MSMIGAGVGEARESPDEEHRTASAVIPPRPPLRRKRRDDPDVPERVPIRTTWVIVFLALQSSSGLANERDDIAGILSQRIDAVRAKQPIERAISKEQWQASDPNRVLSVLSPCRKDSSRAVRRLALVYGMELAEAHPTPSVRREVSGWLVESAIAHSVSGELRWLKKFTASDFDDRSKALVRQALLQPADEAGGDVSVWICGIADMRDQLPRLNELTMDELNYQAGRMNVRKWYLTTAWAARLARARMGVKEDMGGFEGQALVCALSSPTGFPVVSLGSLRPLWPKRFLLGVLPQRGKCEGKGGLSLDLRLP